MPRYPEQRSLLLQIYQAALEAVAGDWVVSHWLEANPQEQELAVVAIGKAAEQMAVGAFEAAGSRIADGLVITRQALGLLHGRERVRLLVSDHPLPGKSSLMAGDALLKFLTQQPRSRKLLFLISGGASSLVEVPEAGVDLRQLQRCNQWLLGSGLAIDRINAVRQRLSAIKGGKLLRHLDGRAAEVLLISDVRGDDPAIIGSGLLHPPSFPVPLPKVPDWMQPLMAPPAQIGASVPPHHLLANLDKALEAAESKGRSLGLKVHLDREYLCGDAREEGILFARRLLEAEKGLYLRGGETTVKLPAKPGRGGRNQHLALAAATVLAGESGILVLAAGTDGSDGPTEDAGALVDGWTLARAGLHGFDAEQSLQGADSGSLLEATGDLIQTGPTGTNVTDLLFGLKF